MADNKKYYYLKLKENFYDSEQMIILQNMQDGYLYSDILMKLYLRSLKTDGKLMFNNIIPYTPNVLAQVVRHQVGTVEKALKVFKELGLVEILDNGAIYMLDIQNFIGKSSTEADRIRQYRQEISNEKMIGCTNVQEMYDKNTPEIELEIEIEKEIDIERDKKHKFIPPTLEEIETYCKERNNNIDAKKFYDYFTVSNWVDSKGNKVKNWKQKIITWEKNQNEKKEIKIPKWFDKNLEIEEGIDDETRRLIEEIEGTPTNNS